MGLEIGLHPINRSRAALDRIEQVIATAQSPPENLTCGTKEHDKYTFFPSILVAMNPIFGPLSQKQREETIGLLRESLDVYMEIPEEERKPSAVSNLKGLLNGACCVSRTWYTLQAAKNSSFF